MAKKLTKVASIGPEKLPVIHAAEKFNIFLGGKNVTLNFGTMTFIRIKEARPQLTTSFDVMEEMAAYEAIPFLIDCAIRPEDKTWKSFAEFLEIYDQCDDDEAIAKVLPGYLSACGAVVKKISPALVAINALNENGTK